MPGYYEVTSVDKVNGWNDEDFYVAEVEYGLKFLKGFKMDYTIKTSRENAAKLPPKTDEPTSKAAISIYVSIALSFFSIALLIADVNNALEIAYFSSFVLAISLSIGLASACQKLKIIFNKTK